MKLLHLTCAAVLVVAPITAMAQTTSPSVGANNQKEASDVQAGAKSQTGAKPGATGSTVVPGSKSTVASDKSATDEQKQGSVKSK